jgi:pyruvate dehydrogenase E2 component (dihydrolipoamide acetyltransferase)
MPKFGQMTEESTIVEWRKKEGDPIAKGDILFDVETDKSTMEVESFVAGILMKILVPAGRTVPVQSVVALVGQPGEQIPDETIPAPAEDKASIAAPNAMSQRAGAAPPAVRGISPRAAALARQHAIDPARITGTGPQGRIIEQDVKALLGNVRTVTNAAADDPVDVAIPLSRMRQVAAQRVTESVLTAPHFFVTVEVDMTDLLALRSQLKSRGHSPTVTDFISQAAVLTLREFADFNSTTDGKTVRRRGRVHLGIAVMLEDGLVVPVLRNADKLTLAEIHQQTRELIDKARAGRLAPDEMSGSTFTISNMGMLDVEAFTAIINPGESAILAVASVVRRPVAREDDQIVVRSMMKITLSSDHRLIDGGRAAGFVNALRHRLEDVELWSRLTALG